jgi:hypothetical protein
MPADIKVFLTGDFSSLSKLRKRAFKQVFHGCPWLQRCAGSRSGS